MSETTIEARGVPTVEVPELLDMADAGEPFVLLDVRNDDEYARWKLEGREPVETLHVPYFDFIEDEEGSMARIPKDRDVVVLCAQGDSSEMIADMLDEKGYSARNVAGGMVAYGEYLQPVKVPLRAEEAERFELWQLNRRGKGCLSYVIRSGGEAVVVDPSRHVDQYDSFLEKMGAKPVWVLDSHVHADHASGGPELAAKHGIPYFVDAGSDFELKKKVHLLEDGEEIRLGGDRGVRVKVQAVKTPGHTPGSTSYWVADRYLLTGDTIFVRSVGRPDLGGQVVQWGKSLFHTLKDRLASVPDDTVILPAHYADVSEIGAGGVVSGRLGELRGAVPELRIETEEEFVEAMRRAVTAPPEAYERIIRVNLGQEEVGDDELTEWELGKNQCAASMGART